MPQNNSDPFESKNNLTGCISLLAEVFYGHHEALLWFLVMFPGCQGKFHGYHRPCERVYFLDYLLETRRLFVGPRECFVGAREHFLGARKRCLGALDVSWIHGIKAWNIYCLLGTITWVTGRIS